MKFLKKPIFRQLKKRRLPYFSPFTNWRNDKWLNTSFLILLISGLSMKIVSQNWVQRNQLALKINIQSTRSRSFKNKLLKKPVFGRLSFRQLVNGEKSFPQKRPKVVPPFPGPTFR